jgi:hypothetical protein
MTERNFYLRQDTYMGFPDGEPWISSAVPGSEDDKALSSGWFTRDDGTQVKLDGCSPIQVCAETARAVEDRLPEWHCFCAICGDNASWRDPS